MPFKLLFVASIAFSLPAAALAADRGSESQQRYQDERAACMKLEAGDERKTCLREAGAARQAAQKRQLDDGEAAFQKNQLARCGYLPAADRDECERRMKGEGTVTGSVEGGGIYRELRTEVPAPEAPASGGSAGGSQRSQ